MPGWQAFALLDPAISTARRQPVNRFQFFWRELNTVWHIVQTLWIIGATRSRTIQQFAGHFGISDFLGIFIFQFNQTTESATITQGFPLGLREFGKAIVFPKFGT